MLSAAKHLYYNVRDPSVVKSTLLQGDTFNSHIKIAT